MVRDIAVAAQWKDSGMDVPVIELTGIVKSFGPVDVLKGVDLKAFAGKVTALVGDNGAGKSTLVKGLAGVQPYDGGSVKFNGEEITLHTPREASALGIEVVYQDLALCDNLDVVSNLFLGRELHRSGGLDEIEMEQRAWTLLRELSAKLPSVRIPVASLSGGQRQTVAIARSLIGDPSIVILDEPTAALGVAQTAEVLNLIERLRERGLGVILISHNIADVQAVADRIVVLRLGKNNGDFRVADVTSEKIIAAITGAGDFSTPQRPTAVAPLVGIAR